MYFENLDYKDLLPTSIVFSISEDLPQAADAQSEKFI